MKKQLNKLLLLLTLIITINSHSQSYCNSNPVDIHGKLSVSGNKIIDQNNSPVSFAGNSMFWSNTEWDAEKFYNADVVSWLKKDWGTTIVRAAMGVEDNGGYLSDSSNKDRVKTIVDAAIAEGLYVIIDWHSHGAENYQSQAVAFFEEMASLYGNYPNIIYEIYNEPIYSSWSQDIKPYAETVISAIRAIDSDNLIIVGTPTWSQDVDVASKDPITSSTNIAYTLHFYAGTHTSSLRAKAQTALDNGVALMVTEWGTVSASGDGSVDSNSTDEWMDFLAENNISHLNWSVNDKAEGASILKSGASEYGNWSDANLTDSGTKVKEIIKNWTKYCDGEPISDDSDTTTEAEYISIPSRIEAVNYSSQSGTLTETTSDTSGDKNVGYIDADDFLMYNINVHKSGNYTINFRIASNTAGINFDIYTENTIIGNLSSDATGGWQTWETISTSVYLNEGKQTIKLLATGAGWNINWLEFTEENIDTSEPADFTSIPSKIEAEDFDTQSGILTQSTSDVNGGKNAGWINSDDYLTYNIDVPNTGYYTVYFRLASSTNGANFDIYSGNSVIGSIASEATGGWQTWETVATTISLNKGEQTIKLIATEGGWNINWLEFAEGEEEDEDEDEQGEGEGDYTDTNCNNIPTWSATDIYAEKGTQVVYENNIYENKWYTQNQNPVEFSVNSWDLWTLIGSCDNASSKEIGEENIVKVFQSSSEKITLSVSNIEDYSTVTIFDMQGRTIVKQQLTQNISEISLDGYSNGIYFLNLNGKGKPSQTTFIKN